LGDAVVTPGLVAAHHPLFNPDAADPDASHLSAADFLAPNDADLRALRDNGFLTVVLAPGSQNVLAGRVCAVRAGDRNQAVLGEIGAKFVLSSAARNAERYPASLAGQVEFLEERLAGGAPETELYLPTALRTALLARREKGIAPVR